MVLKKSTLRCIVSACDGRDIDIYYNTTGCRHNFVSLFFQHFQNGNLQKCTITFTPCLSASVCLAVCVTTWETLNIFAWRFIFLRCTKICHHIPHLWLKLDKITGVLCKTCMCFKQFTLYLRTGKCWTEFVERMKQQGVYLPSLLYCVYIAWCVYYFYHSNLVFPKLIDSRTPLGLESTVRTHKEPGS